MFYPYRRYIKDDLHHPLLIPSWINYSIDKAGLISFLVAFTKKQVCMGTIAD